MHLAYDIGRENLRRPIERFVQLVRWLASDLECLGFHIVLPSPLKLAAPNYRMILCFLQYNSCRTRGSNHGKMDHWPDIRASFQWMSELADVAKLANSLQMVSESRRKLFGLDSAANAEPAGNLYTVLAASPDCPAWDLPVPGARA